MRLKTRLVLVFFFFVFLFVCFFFFFYVSNLVDAAVLESYNSNRQTANQVRFALQQSLDTGLKDQTIAPGDTSRLMELATETIRSSKILRAAIDAPVMYSLTVNDITITDAQDHILLTTLPGSPEKLDPRRKYCDLV